MRADFETKIDGIYKAQQHALQAQDLTDRETCRIRSDLLDRFITLRRDVIRSIMSRYSCYFTDNLYTCSIINDDHHVDHIGRRAYRAGITLRVYKGANLGDELKFVPHYAVLWDEVNNLVRFYRNNATKSLAGSCDYDGKSELYEVTADVIEQRLISFTNWLFCERVVV